MAREPGKIRKLEEVVINRIAAGEVIQRPGNALKELLENSLDAESSNIQVVVKNGGMKLLQIQDDGSGIRREDLAIVCERFTTSKLEKFEDLQSIGTYGFRGEALASISHVAHLTILTKTEDSQCAFRAEYSDGKLKEYQGQVVQNPKPCAGKQGTLIIVEDLFYNMETRRRALKSASEEHNKIAEVVTKYAVHNANVGFSLKKFGETMTEIRTPSQSTTLDNIKILYGASISRELVEISCEDKTTGFTLQGYISNVNYSTKKLTFLLFINNRLVDSLALRKAIESVYYSYLPKGSHPFVYLSIKLDPRNVDVNVHPTKHEVHFLHEDMITSTITNSVDNILTGSNHSRTFFVQSLLPGAQAAGTSDTGSNAKVNKRKADEDRLKNSQSSSTLGTAAKNMVRTDPKMQKLDKFFSSTPDGNISKINSFQDTPSRITSVIDVESSSKEGAASSNHTPGGMKSDIITGSCERREIRLRSVSNMRQKVQEDSHAELTSAFRKLTFVGCVDRTLSLIQHELNLYICNTFKLSAELFYQKMLIDFGNLGKITLNEPITIQELVQFALEGGEQCDENKTPEQMATEIQELLLSKARMLDDYFSLTFDDSGRLKSIPSILDDYLPSMVGLPNYIMNLARKVNWSNEQACFETFCHQTSLFYAVQPGTFEELEESDLNEHSWKWTIEHIVYPEIKKSLLVPKLFAEDSTLVLLTSLPELYKVFERC